ncbi:neurofilament heavy polypeptide-like [Macadamia integrifolia]|uniref:neurofilament heavy polypeptide-like n=1 Tax=Macadamia integrifolia TaxID=60698 RepID=UPI001C4E7454|nr:neurofilament heavy polypeptide-like [Macadamia integrifolia]XP_042517974.1 neurofilament heavy polypeptide-like [Macadamia integrifolia]XP_042517975.1 neurofilament heavy polypeptide-like [Macadamia integrifolia]
MAEERIEIMVTPERTMSEDINNARNSTGKTSTSSSSKKILPLYLRASTGSCHDFCKYGRKHAFEAKEKRHIPRRVATTMAKGEYSVNTVIVSEIKKKTAIKRRPSLDSKTKLPNCSEIIKQEAPSSSKKKEASPKQVLSHVKQIEVSPRQASAHAKKIVVSPKQAVSPAKKIEASPKQAVSPAKKIEVSWKQALSPSKKIEVCPKQALSPAKKLEASTEPNVYPPKRSNASANHVGYLESKSVVIKPSPPSGLSGSMGGKRNGDRKVVKKMGNSKIDEKKMSRTPIASVSPKPSVINTRKYNNVKAVSPLKSQNKVNEAEPVLSSQVKEKTFYVIERPESKSLELALKKAEPMLSNQVKEKTLYVIEHPESISLEPAQNGSHTNQSCPSSSLSSLLSLNSSSSQSSPLLSTYVEEENEESESESMLSEADDPISEYDETDDENQVETSDVEDKKPGRGAGCPDNTDCLPQKLHFRRGQVVDLQSENSGPRRLRFRQGRVLGENDGKGDIAKRSYRRGGTRSDTYGTKPESEKVVLRHQDLQGKKDAQGLFNNVIEVTASKLVETRKSKVKALVGAFETVISLQDGKPSAD